MKTNIYILTDGDGPVRYVGKTRLPLAKRLSGHKAKANTLGPEVVVAILTFASCAAWGPVIDLTPPKAPPLCCLRHDGPTVVEVCAPPSREHVRYCRAVTP